MYLTHYGDILGELDRSGNLRRLPDGDSDTSSVVDLSSNDYLGLAADPSIQADFMDDPQRRAVAMTSSASRLLAGRQSEYRSLELLLGELYGREALLFNSGYHANTGLVSALADKGTLILADRLVHASIIDGIRLSGADFSRFPHNDFDRLEALVARRGNAYERILVIVESVYSMDGDRADIDRLTDLRRRYPSVMLYVDEAHAFGVEGPAGLGLVAGSMRPAEVDVIVGTFGKAAASAGAFAAVHPTIREYLVNRARSLIFSTALPPISAAWTEYLLRRHILPGDDRREALSKLSLLLNERLRAIDPEATAAVPSHIQPYITGSADAAVALSRRLLERGFKVLPIRTPTVPPGTERLRISLAASIAPEVIVRFADALAEVSGKKCNFAG